MRVPFPAFRHRMMRIVRHPLLPFLIGCTMVASSVADVIETLIAGEPVTLGVEHGVLLYGASVAVKALLELLEGVEKLRDAVPAVLHGKSPPHKEGTDGHA